MNHKENNDGDKPIAEMQFDVFWDEPANQDPADPMNWNMTQKWAIIAIVSFITFLTWVLSRYT